MVVILFQILYIQLKKLIIKRIKSFDFLYKENMYNIKMLVLDGVGVCIIKRKGQVFVKEL